MSATQLWGLEVSVGDWTSVAAPAAASASSVLSVSGATLVPTNRSQSDTSLGMTTYLLSVQTEGGAKPVVVCSLSASRPHALLNLSSALKGSRVAFQLSTVPTSAASSANYSVHLSGFVQEAAAAAAPAANPNAALAVQAPKRKAETATPGKPEAKKAKASASAPASDDDDDAPASTPATPKAAKAATAASTPSTPKSASKPSIVVLKNGLKLQDTKVGTGKEAVDRSAVSIRYRGSLASNGKVFDSNMPRGQPLRFKIGGGDVIAGFEQGTKGMKVGGTRTVVIPSQLGYGARGAPPDIPPNATLVFDLELVSVK